MDKIGLKITTSDLSMPIMSHDFALSLFISDVHTYFLVKRDLCDVKGLYFLRKAFVKSL